MNTFGNIPQHIANLNSLAGGLFIISALGIVAVRQVRACMRFFILQSLFLSLSAFLLGSVAFHAHLMTAALINFTTKVILIPWILQSKLHEAMYTRREISQVLSIPISLLTSLLLIIGAYFFTLPFLEHASQLSPLRVNLPIGLAGIFLGAYTLSVRREAVPQLFGLLAMENGAFFAGIAIAPDLPMIAELTLAFDILMLTFVLAVLTGAVHKNVGTTAVGRLASLREKGEK